MYHNKSCMLQVAVLSIVDVPHPNYLEHPAAVDTNYQWSQSTNIRVSIQGTTPSDFMMHHSVPLSSSLCYLKGREKFPPSHSSHGTQFHS